VAGELAVRRAEDDDFEAWFEMFEAVATEGRWIGAEAPVDREEARRAFDRTVSSDRVVRFLAEIDGELVGELFVGVHGGVGDLGMLVRDGYRGRGVGSTLMDECLEWCRSVEVHKVTLNVFPHNERGLALYRKHGFAVEGRLVRHYRRRNGELWDAIAMGRVLDEGADGSPFEDAPDLG
jgi:RimJ/RimL family protein N-acetyltransferase